MLALLRRAEQSIGLLVLFHGRALLAFTLNWVRLVTGPPNAGAVCWAKCICHSGRAVMPGMHNCRFYGLDSRARNLRCGCSN